MLAEAAFWAAFLFQVFCKIVVVGFGLAESKRTFRFEVGWMGEREKIWNGITERGKWF